MAYTATSLTDLQAFMATRWDASVFWTAEEARLALNEALRDWNLLTGRWRTRVTLSSLAANPEIALPASLTFGMRVRVGTAAALDPASVADLDLGRPSWRRETTTTGGDVPTRPIIWAPQSLTRIVIWPATVGAGTNNVLVDGVAATPVLVRPADLVDLGDEVVDVIADYAVHIVAFKEGGPRWKATQGFFTAFLQAAALENTLLKRKQAYRRIAGLDRRRDLQPTKSGQTQLDSVIQNLPSLSGGGGG